MRSAILMLIHVPAMHLAHVGRRLPNYHISSRPLVHASRTASRLAVRCQTTAAPESRFITGETGNNVSPYIEALVGRNLCAERSALHPSSRVRLASQRRGRHKLENHPLGIIKNKIEKYFNRRAPSRCKSVAAAHKAHPLASVPASQPGGRQVCDRG